VGLASEGVYREIVERKPRRLARTVIYEHPWVNLYVDRVLFPAGRIVEKHHVLEFDWPAVAALVEDAQGQVLLVRVYRYTTDSIEWGVPAGKMEEGESIVEAARREAWEETGYETSGHELIYTYCPMNGISNKVFHIVRCKAGEKTGEFDPNEVQQLRWASREETEAMLKERVVRDGLSLTALLFHLARW
jgi:ADP-ribose pyrophosphatase